MFYKLEYYLCLTRDLLRVIKVRLTHGQAITGASN